MDGTKKKRDNTLIGHQNCILGLSHGQNLQGDTVYFIKCLLIGRLIALLKTLNIVKYDRFSFIFKIQQKLF